MENVNDSSSLEQDPPLNPPSSNARKPGGWRAIKYILGTQNFAINAKFYNHVTQLFLCD